MQYDLSILFHLQKGKENKKGQAPIYLRITVNGKRAELSTNESINTSQWDSSLQRAKGRSESARTLNDHLDSLQTRLRREFNKLTENEEDISADKLKDILTGKYLTHHYLVDVFIKSNKLIEMEVGSKYTKDTFVRYQISIERLKSFLLKEYKTTDIKLAELNHVFIQRYEAFLRIEYKCDHNTVMKYLKHLKKVVHFAMRMGYIERDPFFQYKTAYNEAIRGYLTAEELNRIELKKFRIPRLERVKDVFVFVCYTGLSYSDLIELTPDSVIKGIDGKNWIIYYRKKTGVRASIPLLSPALAIVEKYRMDPECITNNQLLPVISNQKLNAYLVEIADLCEIDKHVTMHVGRHTFATTVTLTNGVPIETVSKMLGHTSLKTTQIYSKVVDTKISEDMGKIEEKLKIKAG
jgi:site-specific recombinase XerD